MTQNKDTYFPGVMALIIRNFGKRLTSLIHISEASVLLWVLLTILTHGSRFCCRMLTCTSQVFLLLWMIQSSITFVLTPNRLKKKTAHYVNGLAAFLSLHLFIMNTMLLVALIQNG